MKHASIRVEVCVATVAESLTAESAGADRLELNSGLPLGGLTPSAALVQRVLQDCRLPVIAMVRPRPGGFCYSADDWNTLLNDATWLTAAGVHGLAFGCLTAERTIDVDRVREMRTRHPETELVFHRAFDLTKHWEQAIDQLIECGINRVMTSGQAPSVPEGIEKLAKIIEYANGRIEIIPAGGINETNVVEIVRSCGCDQIHGSFSSSVEDPGYLDAAIRFAPNDSIRQSDERKIAAAIAALKDLSS